MNINDIQRAVIRCPSFAEITQRELEVTIHPARMGVRYNRGGYWCWLVRIDIGSVTSEVSLDHLMPVALLDQQIEPHLQAALQDPRA